MEGGRLPHVPQPHVDTGRVRVFRASCARVRWDYDAVVACTKAGSPLSMNSVPIKVLCADDHPLVREGISALVSDAGDMHLIAEAATGLEAIDQFRRWRPDVTLMDLKMPQMGGIEAIVAIRSEFPDAKIVVLTTYRGDVLAQRALTNGASAYLLKSDVRKDLLETIREVHAGRTKINAEVAVALAGQVAQDALSARELSVLQQIAAGKTNRDIGDQLFLTEGTVKNHVKSILAKLQARDRTHAVILGLERGIIGV